jgi:macrolide transport system ATP-binding/permease protein
MFARLSSLWRNLAHRERVDRDLDDELASVYQLLVDEKIQQGLKPEHARRQARLELGGVDPVKQRVREERSGALFETLVKDARYAFRMVRANPGFAFIVVVSLAAGIGANSAIFSVANAVMWRSLPVSSPEQLHIVRVQSRLPMTPRFSYPFFEQLRQGFPDPHGLAAMSRVARVRARIADGGEQEAAGVQLVSGDYFSVLALQPLLGRLLTPDDNRTVGGHPIAVVSHAFWQRRLAAAADVVGRNVTLNGARFTVVGVAPEGFTGVWLETPVDAWIPAAMQADIYYAQNVSADNARLEQPWMPQDNIRWLEIVLRADRPDGPEAVALNAVFRPVLLQAAGAIADVEQRNLLLDRRLILEPFAHGSSILRDRFRAPLFALLAMTALLLLIACANTANLLLARAAARQREMAIRLSIGASRSRVIGQLLTESVIFGAMAAAVGLGVAPLASELLVRMTIAADSGPLPFSVGIDGRLLAFTALVSVLTSLLFGLAPAWRATDLTLGEALKATARGVHRGGRASLTRSLVVVQVALSLLLVVGAGLFLQSLQNLATLPLGFEREHLVSAWIRPGTGGYERADLPGLYRRLIDAAEGLPGVQSAAVSMCGLMTGCRVNVDGLVISGYESQPGERVMVQENRVGPRYFATVGMQLVEGRDFEARDVRNPATVAIVNEATVRKYFQNRSAIGQRIGEDRAEIEIIGVVRDARVNSVREAVVPMAYYPLEPDEFANTLDVRTVGDPGRIADALRKVVAAVDPNLPLDRVTMIAEQAGSTLRQERLIARLTTVLCVLALGMACLGLYGVMSYGVKQRTPELGIRFALGASRPLVLWTVLRESLALVAIGVGIGLPLVLAASQIVGTMLFEVSPSNPTTIAASILLLLALGAISGYQPAWRASRVDPLTALRHE